MNVRARESGNGAGQGDAAHACFRWAPLLTGVVLAVTAGVVVSAAVAAALALGSAFVLGLAGRSSPFRIGILLMTPVGMGTLAVAATRSPGLLAVALVADAAAALALGLVAALGATLAEADG